MIEIKYEMKPNSWECKTRCKLRNGIRVGSTACIRCWNFISEDRKKRIIKCENKTLDYEN